MAYGTSAPELSVSTAAVLEDSSAIALGNVIGSCIANFGLILGLTALIAPPAVDGRLIRREVPVLIVSALVPPLTLLDGAVSRLEGMLLVTCAALFTLYTLFVSSGSSRPEDALDSELGRSHGSGGTLKLIAFAVAGMALLIGGGELFVDGAKGVALSLGMSERLVGLTVVAIGTSMPELVASLVAAIRRESSLAIGNVVGSNIFNVFLILGVAGTIRPVQGSLQALRVDMLFLVGITLLGVLFMRGERRVTRLEGLVLVAAYAAFIVLVSLGL